MSDDLAVFHAANLPAHVTNADTDAVLDWPRSPSGVEFMPMSGQFMVQAADGSQIQCADGFLLIGADGHPQWQAEVPA